MIRDRFEVIMYALVSGEEIQSPRTRFEMIINAIVNAIGGGGGGGNNYSTDETVIGTWIDGSSVYRKVVELSDITLNSGIWVPITALAALNAKQYINVTAINTTSGNSMTGMVIDASASPDEVRSYYTITPTHLIVDYVKDVI